MAITGIEYKSTKTDWNKKTRIEIAAAYDAILDIRDMMLEKNLIGKEWDVTSELLSEVRTALYALDNLKK